VALGFQDWRPADLVDGVANRMDAGEGAVRTGIGIGDTLRPTGSLRDVRGNQRSLTDFGSYAALVLAFTGTECPLMNLYIPRIIRIEERYRSQVKFIAVYPNENETSGDIAVHSDERDIPFLQVKDFGQQLADELGIERTGAVVILDGDLVLRYRGRIDDQYSVASRKAEASRQDLVRALDELLGGSEIGVPETEADGCLLDRTRMDMGIEGVTYTKDVAPIIQRRCQNCHRPGQIGPFSLLTYQDAVKWKSMVEEVVVQKRMPPWQADPRYGHFSNDRSMPDGEIAILRSWLDHGTPRGDPNDMPPPREWPGGEWNIGKPDVIFSSPREIDVPADGVMDYIYLTAPTNFEEDVWVEKAELRPGDPSVVHHVLVYLRPPGSRRIYEADGSTTALVGWAPGDQPMSSPPGTAVKIPAGTQLVWELHYTPNGKATVDRTSVGLTLALEPPEREAKLNIFANRGIEIEPGAPHHKHEATFEFKEDSRIISLMPHMHLRGKSWKYEATYPDGSSEILLSVPRWDFNWQTVYFFDEPLFVPEGTLLKATARWDNSDNNLLNPDPADRVGYGLQTFNEMMNGWVRYVPDRVPGRK
jgi:hypothetical protein